MNISSIFYFSESTLINKPYNNLWDTLMMMLYKIPHKMKNALAELVEIFGIGLL